MFRQSELSVISKSDITVSSQIRFIKCAQHPEEAITNFCCGKACMIPLCPDCIDKHSQEHRRRGTFPDIQSLKMIKTACASKLAQLQTHIESLFDQAEELAHFHPGREQQTDSDANLERIDECKKRIITEVTQFFDQLIKSYEQNKGFNTKLSGSAKFLQESLSKYLENIETMHAKLEGQYSLFDAIKEVSNLDWSTGLDGLKNLIKETYRESEANGVEVTLEVVFEEKQIENIQQLLQNCVVLMPKDQDIHLKTSLFKDSIGNSIPDITADLLRSCNKINKHYDDQGINKISLFTNTTEISEINPQQFPSQKINNSQFYASQPKQQQVDQQKQTQDLFGSMEQQSQGQQRLKNNQNNQFHQDQDSFIDNLSIDQRQENQYFDKNIKKNNDYSASDWELGGSQSNSQEAIEQFPEHEDTEQEIFTNQDNSDQQEKQFPPQQQQQQNYLQSDNTVSFDAPLDQTNDQYQVSIPDYFLPGCVTKSLPYFSIENQSLYLVDVKNKDNAKITKYQITQYIGDGHRLVITPAGQIFILGGVDSQAQETNNVYCFDQTTGAFRVVSPMINPRTSFSAIYLGGYIYVVGGKIKGKHVSECERYDCKTNSWKRISNLNLPVSSAAICGFGNTHLIKIGGLSPGQQGNNSYYPSNSTGQFSNGVNVSLNNNNNNNTQRSSSSSQSYRQNPNQSTQMNSSAHSNNQIEVYNISANKWDVARLMHEDLQGVHPLEVNAFNFFFLSGVLQISESTLMIFGGQHHKQPTQTTFCLDIKKKSKVPNQFDYILHSFNLMKLPDEGVIHYPVINQNSQILAIQNIGLPQHQNQKRLLTFDGNHWKSKILQFL